MLLLFLLYEGFHVIEEAGHFVHCEPRHEAGRHERSGESGAEFDVGLFKGVLGARDVAEGNGVAGLIGDEANDGFVVFEIEEVGGEALRDRFVGVEDGFGELVATVGLGDVAKVGAFLRFVLGDGVAGCLLYTLRAHETVLDLVCRLLLEKKKTYLRHLSSPLFSLHHLHSLLSLPT